MKTLGNKCWDIAAKSSKKVPQRYLQYLFSLKNKFQTQQTQQNSVVPSNPSDNLGQPSTGVQAPARTPVRYFARSKARKAVAMATARQDLDFRGAAWWRSQKRWVETAFWTARIHHQKTQSLKNWPQVHSHGYMYQYIWIIKIRLLVQMILIMSKSLFENNMFNERSISNKPSMVKHVPSFFKKHNNIKPKISKNPFNSSNYIYTCII